MPHRLIDPGFRKKGKKDKLNFYNIAQGSLDELTYYLILAKDLNYIKEIEDIKERINEIGKMLTGLMKSVKQSFALFTHY